MPGRWLLALIAGCALGCSTAEPDFTTELAAAQCRVVQKCALGLFEDQFEGLGDCVDETAHDLDEWVAGRFDGCAYDGREASRCIGRVQALSCEAWVRGDDERACDIVYDCTE